MTFRGLMAFAVAASFVVSPAAHAETKTEKVARLFDMMGIQSQMEQTLDKMWPMIVNGIEKKNATIPHAEIESLRSIGQQEFVAALPDIIPPMAKIYEANYTDEELDAMLAFYSSPEGRSAMAKLPTIAGQVFAMSQAWGAQIGQKIAQKVVEQLKNKGYTQ